MTSHYCPNCTQPVSVDESRRVVGAVTRFVLPADVDLLARSESLRRDQVDELCSACLVQAMSIARVVR